MGKIGLETDHSVLIDLGNQSIIKTSKPRKLAAFALSFTVPVLQDRALCAYPLLYPGRK